MLGEQATKFLQALCAYVEDDGFKVRDWVDIQALTTVDADECQNQWEQLRLQGFVNVKYSDTEEVCFEITRKARVLIEECEAISKQYDDKNAVVKTDSVGRAVMVLPSDYKVKNALQRGGRLSSAVFGFFGGIFGSMLTFGIAIAVWFFMK